MKSCPFCGSNEINYYYPDEYGHHVCWCGNCGAFGPNDVSEARAREMWNLRRPMDDLLVACRELLDVWQFEHSLEEGASAEYRNYLRDVFGAVVEGIDEAIAAVRGEAVRREK